MGADAPACAALAGGAEVKAFFVRKETKAHGLQRRIEGPDLEPGERCLVVEDVVTTGGSTVQAIEAVREAGYEVCGVVAILDRLAGGAEAIAAASRWGAVRGARHDRRHLPGPPGPRVAQAFAAAPPNVNGGWVGGGAAASVAGVCHSVNVPLSAHPVARSAGALRPSPHQPPLTFGHA